MVIRTQFNKVIIGQNEDSALVMSDDLNETETVLKLGSELISFIIHNEKIYCGLGNKTVIVLDEATLEILKETYSTQK